MKDFTDLGVDTKAEEFVDALKKCQAERRAR